MTGKIIRNVFTANIATGHVCYGVNCQFCNEETEAEEADAPMGLRRVLNNADSAPLVARQRRIVTAGGAPSEPLRLPRGVLAP
jgi:hypothetical protein